MSNRLPGTVAKELIVARKYLAKKRHWCQDQYTSGVWPFRRYCAAGYLNAHASGAAHDLVDEASRELYGKENVIIVNDYIGHEAVIAVLNRATSLALSRQM